MHVSVKQINMFGALQRPSIGGCPRQWGFNYLDKLKADFLAPQLVDGIKFHAVCASLVKHNRMPAPGELQPGVTLTPDDCLPEGTYGSRARAAIIHLPVRSYRPWLVEIVDKIPWMTSRGVECEIDLRPDLMSEVHPDYAAYLIDFKGTSDKRYALKSLLEDVQANVYAYGIMRLGAPSVLARWIYVNKHTLAAWPVDAVFHPEKTTAWLHANIDPTIELMHTFRDALPRLSGTDLPADIEACQGGARFCDHIARCFGNGIHPKPGNVISLEDVLRFKKAS